MTISIWRVIESYWSTMSSSGFPVQEGLEHIGKSPVEGHQDDGGTGALLWGKTERAGAVQAAEEKAPGGLLCVCKYLKGGCGQVRARLFSVLPSAGTRGNVHKLEHRRFPVNIRKQFCAVCVWVLVQVVQRGCEISFLELFRNCLDVVLVTHVYVYPCLGRVLDQTTDLQRSLTTSSFCDSVVKTSWQIHLLLNIQEIVCSLSSDQSVLRL